MQGACARGAQARRTAKDDGGEEGRERRRRRGRWWSGAGGVEAREWEAAELFSSQFDCSFPFTAQLQASAESLSQPVRAKTPCVFVLACCVSWCFVRARSCCLWDFRKVIVRESERMRQLPSSCRGCHFCCGALTATSPLRSPLPRVTAVTRCTPSASPPRTGSVPVVDIFCSNPLVLLRRLVLPSPLCHLGLL